MSIYNIREKFSYTISSSNIEYIRNYNFNSSTITDIPLFMANSDDVIPITVNITTTRPWVAIVDPTTGANLKYPDGNIILAPSSSKVVLVKIDLPPDVESIVETVERPNISLEIKSGSYPVVPPDTRKLFKRLFASGSRFGSTGERVRDFISQSRAATKNSIVTDQEEYTLDIGEKVTVNLTTYDKNGNPDTKSDVLWRVVGSKEPEKDIEKLKRAENVSTSRARKVVKINSPYDSKSKMRVSYPRTVEGVSSGTMYVLLTPVEDKNKGTRRNRSEELMDLAAAKQKGKRKLIKFTVTDNIFTGTPTDSTAKFISGSNTVMTQPVIEPSTPPTPPVNDESDVEDTTL